MKNIWFGKLAALAAIVLVLVIGLGMIEAVVRDRQHYRHLTEQSVADSLAGAQTLIGPVIHSACVESWDVETGKGDERRMVEQRREFRLTAMPETLRLNTDAAMQERARGVHKVNAFSLQTRIQALIVAEDRSRPLSDSQLVVLLETEGVKIARRTVAKYRELLRIPTAPLRKSQAGAG